MLSSYNDDQKEIVSDRATGAKSKVKILSQVLLKAANLTSRKDYLNKVLENSDPNIKEKRKIAPVTSTPILNESGRPNSTPQTPNESRVNQKEGKRARRNSQRKEMISDSEDSEPYNNVVAKTPNQSREMTSNSEDGDESIGKTPSKAKQNTSNRDVSATKLQTSQHANDSKPPIKTVTKDHNISTESSDTNEQLSESRQNSMSQSDSESNDVKYEIERKTSVNVNKKHNDKEKLAELKKKRTDLSESYREREQNQILDRLRDHSESESGTDVGTQKSTNNKQSPSDSRSKIYSKTVTTDNKSKLSKSTAFDSEKSKFISDTSEGSDSDASQKEKNQGRPKARNSERARHSPNKRKRDSSSSSTDGRRDSSSSSTDSKQNSSSSSADRKRDSSSSSTDNGIDNTLKRKCKDTTSDSDSADGKPTKKAKPLKMPSESQKLLESFATDGNYKSAECKVQNILGNISKNEEIYLLQLPKRINPQLLLGKTISFDGPTKIKLGDNRYLSNVVENAEDIIVANFQDLIPLKTKGTVRLESYFKLQNNSLELSKFSEDIPDFPGDLKDRHPLFGVEYKEKVKLSDEIKCKFNEAAAGSRIKKKKSKKKRHEDVDHKEYNKEENFGDTIDIIKLLNEHESKNSSKHKVVSKETDVMSQSIIDNIVPDTKKNKKKRKGKLIFEHSIGKEESDFVGGDGLNIDKTSKDKECKKDLSGIEELLLDFSTEHKKKRHKKDKDRVISAAQDNISAFLANQSNEEEYKKCNMDPIPMETEILCETAPNHLYNKKKKKKDKDKQRDYEEYKKCDVDNISTKIQLRVETATDHPHKKKKKKKDKKRDHAIEEVINSGVTPLISEGNESVKAKKKSKDKLASNIDTADKKNKEGIRLANSTMRASSVGAALPQLNESCIPNERQKRKNSLTNFIDEILKDATSSEERSPEKKKKHKSKSNKKDLSES